MPCFVALRYFVLKGDSEAFGGWFSSIEASHHVATLLMLWPIAQLSKRIGKRLTCIFAPFFLVLGSIAYLFCFVPDMPWLVYIPRSFMSIGICGLFVLIPSMISDVVDFDELKTGTRREGMFGAVFNWAFKLALGVAVLISGYFLEMSGFKVDLDIDQPEGTIDMMIYLLGSMPIIGAIVALYCVYKYSLTDRKLREIRAELEARRGAS